MLQFMGSQRVGHNLATEERKIRRYFCNLPVPQHSNYISERNHKCMAYFWSLYSVTLDYMSVHHQFISVSSVAQLCLTLCDPMPGLPVYHQLPESTQTHVHWIRDAIQPSHPLLPSSPALNLSQHQGLFEWVSSSHQVAKVLELQLQHQSFFAICQYQQTANI